MNHSDNMIRKALRGTSRDAPLDLVGIIAAIDARERFVVSFEDFESGVRRLVELGEIGEARPLHFFESYSGDVGASFSGITEEQYLTAYRTYAAMMERAAEQMELEPESNDGPLIICRLIAPTSTGFSDEDEEAVENLANQMQQVMPHVANANVIGCERSYERSARRMSILIYGAGANEEVDLIYNAIVPLFRAFPCQPGSCIVRYYDNRQRELVSDLVAPSP